VKKLRPKTLKTVEFKNVEGRAVPMAPWPQRFYISGFLLNYDAVEVRWPVKLYRKVVAQL
jgi:hypothetical protein